MNPTPTLPPPSTDPLPKTAPPEKKKDEVETLLKGIDLKDEAAVKPFHVRFVFNSFFFLVRTPRHTRNHHRYSLALGM